MGYSGVRAMWHGPDWWVAKIRDRRHPPSPDRTLLDVEGKLGVWI